MAVEVAFESPDQISQRLCRYQDQFQYRYTERDEGYRQCLQNASRVLQVPVMNPWPPRGSHTRRGGRYDDWDGGGGRRRGYRGRRRDYHPPYHHHRYHDDRHYEDRHYDDRPPWGYGPRSPRDDFRERSPPRRSPSPHSHPHYHRQRSSSPLPYPPPPGPHVYPPHHPPHLSPRHTSHLSPHHHPHHSSRSRSHSPVPHCRSPVREMNTEGESGNDQSGNDQEAPPTVPHPLNLDLEEQEEKVVVPSESDVLDILSSAHALQSKVTAENLRKVQREGRKTHHTRKDETGKTGKKLTITGKSRDAVTGLGVPAAHGVGVLVSHGKTEVVSTSFLLGRASDEGGGEGRGGDKGGGRGGGGGKDIPQKKMKKRKQKARSDEEGPSGGGGDTVGLLEYDAVSVGGAVIPEREGRREGLVMRLDKKFCHSQTSMPGGSHSVPSTPSSDLTPTFSLATPSLSSLPHPYTTHRDLRVVCNRLTTTDLPPPPSTATPHLHPTATPHLHPTATPQLHPTATPPLSPTAAAHTKEKKRKKKKKKHAPEGVEREGEGAGLVSQGQGVLKLKINLKPHDS